MNVYLDTETTGFLKDGGCILELAIVDDNGTCLFNKRVKPHAWIPGMTWPKAESIHGISPGMVADSAYLVEFKEEIANVLLDKDIVIYNADFDWPFILEELGEEFDELPKSVNCAMARYAPIHGDWNDYYESYRWQKLIVAAKIAGHEWTGKAHTALCDARACRTVWHWMDGEEERQRQEVKKSWEAQNRELASKELAYLAANPREPRFLPPSFAWNRTSAQKISPTAIIAINKLVNDYYRRRRLEELAKQVESGDLHNGPNIDEMADFLSLHWKQVSILLPSLLEALPIGKTMD